MYVAYIGKSYKDTITVIYSVVILVNTIHWARDVGSVYHAVIPMSLIAIYRQGWRFHIRGQRIGNHVRSAAKL